jgi:hypothetical protein
MLGADRGATGDRWNAVSAIVVAVIAVKVDVVQKSYCLTAAAAGGVASRCFYCGHLSGVICRKRQFALQHMRMTTDH